MSVHNSSGDDGNGNGSDRGYTTTLDWLMGDPVSFCAMLYPRVDCADRRDESRQDQYVDPKRGYASHGSNGILGVVQETFGKYFYAHIMLTFEQAVRLVYMSEGRKHGNLNILIFLVCLERCKSIEQAIREELVELDDPYQTVELFEAFMAALRTQSKALRNAPITAVNSKQFFERFTTLMSTMWALRSIEYIKRYCKGDDETSRRTTACDIGETDKNAMEQRRSSSKRARTNKTATAATTATTSTDWFE